MALGSLASPEGSVGVGGGATAPIIKVSVLGSLKDTFGQMKESLGAMVGLQTEESKRQAAVDEKLLAQKDFEIEMQNKEFVDSGAAGPQRPTSNDDLEGVDTDDKTYGNFVEKAETAGGNILDSIKDAFDQTSFGEKMMAVILAGGFLLFSKYSETIEKYLQPIVQFVMDIIDLLGPEGAFFAFLGGFVLLKSGLAKKGLMKAGGFILKTIKASAASLDRQGGLFKAMGNGFERINKGAKGLVGQLGKMGKMITGGLTKGFTMLGRGLTALRLGVMSMYSSIMPMIAPFLPIIAIAAAVVAVFVSLKSGFETFKESLDNGDSMFTAVIKGLGDAMLTLVTLPYVLIQKLVGFIAGLFGFDNFKEKLESFDIKEQIVNALGSLVGGLVKVLKGVAKGAGAALAAVFSFSNPVEAFAKAYAAVMAGGEGESAALQGTSDYQGDQSQKDFNDDSKERDKVKGFNKMDTSEMGGDLIGGTEGQGTGNATAMSYYAKQEEDRRYRDLGTGPKSNLSADDMMRMKGYTVSGMSDSQFDDATGYDDFSKEMGMVPVQNQEFEAKLERTTVMKEGKVVSDESKIIYVKGGDKQGDTINQMSETNITGELEVNHNELTQKTIQEHF